MKPETDKSKSIGFTLSPSTWNAPVTVDFPEFDLLYNPVQQVPLKDETSLVITYVKRGLSPSEPFYDVSHLCSDRDIEKYKSDLGCISRMDSVGKTNEQFVQELTRYIESLG